MRLPLVGMRLKQIMGKRKPTLLKYLTVSYIYHIITSTLIKNTHKARSTNQPLSKLQAQKSKNIWYNKISLNCKPCNQR